jgi:hypothetical protein
LARILMGAAAAGELPVPKFLEAKNERSMLSVDD